jgi:hypothetical protein
MGAIGLDANDEHYVWPPGLLTFYDFGCAIYHAIDLDDPNLWFFEYQLYEPEQDAEANGDRFAYAEPVVPRRLQRRFVVVANSLEEWLRSK